MNSWQKSKNVSFFWLLHYNPKVVVMLDGWGPWRMRVFGQHKVEEALHAILETMAGAVATGEPVVLKDFGRFSTWQRKQRIRGFDGQAHEVDEVQLAFKASAILRRRLKEKSS